MDPEIAKQLAELKERIDRLYKYIKIGLIIYTLSIVLPLIGLAFAIPYYLSTLNQALNF